MLRDGLCYFLKNDLQHMAFPVLPRRQKDRNTLSQGKTENQRKQEAQRRTFTHHITFFSHGFFTLLPLNHQRQPPECSLNGVRVTV